MSLTTGFYKGIKTFMGKCEVKKNNLKIDVGLLGEGDNCFIFAVNPEEAGLSDNELKFLSAVEGSVKVNKIEERIIVTGTVKAKVSLICSRCLGETQLSIENDFFMEYSKVSSGAISGQRKKEEGENVVVEYTGDIIDITDEIRESVLLSIPSKSLCSVNCRGLCPQCGKNLNNVACDCKNKFLNSFSNRLHLDLGAEHKK